VNKAVHDALEHRSCAALTGLHPPVALSITECVLNVRGDLSTQLGIAEIL